MIDAVGFGFGACLLVLYLTQVVIVRYYIKGQIERSSILTIMSFSLYFVLVFINWTVYLILSLKSGENQEEKQIFNEFFYLGDLFSSFLIMITEVYYTFEMYLAKGCLTMISSEDYFKS